MKILFFIPVRFCRVGDLFPGLGIMTGGNCKTSQVSRGPGEQVYKEGSEQAAVKKTDKLGQRTKSTKTSG